MFKKSIIICMLASIFMLVGCTSDNKKIVIAGKPMTEQYIIVEMLSQLIEEKTDITVEQKPGIGGGTSNIHPAMEKGEIDIYPEYTGTGLLFVLKEELINDPNELYEAVKKGYEDNYNIKWTGLYGFNNTFGLAVKKEVAEKYNIKTYSDLAKYNEELAFGAEYDFYEREDGYLGLETTYGFDFKEKKELDIGLKYEAIASDEVDVINVFSTDGRLKAEGLIVLEDDKNFFPSYFAATLVRNETLNKYPELEEVLELLTDNISNDEIIEMNYLVEIEKQDPKDVANEFLKKKGLL